MFDFAWSELMVIGAVALIVIGPKDLPRALRTLGVVVRRARGMAREFQASFDEMIREAELDEVRRSVREATSFDPNQQIMKALDPRGQIPSFVLPPEPLDPPPAEDHPVTHPPSGAENGEGHREEKAIEAPKP